MTNKFMVLNINFKISEKIILNKFSGFESRRIFYNVIKLANEKLANELHESKKLSPFSSTPIYTLLNEKMEIVNRKLTPNKIYTMRYTILSKKLCNLIAEIIWKDIFNKQKIKNEIIEIIDFKIKSIDYVDLYKNSEPIKYFLVNFLTPTYFRVSPYILAMISKNVKNQIFPLEYLKRIYRYYPLPNPSLLIRNIVRIWKQYSNYHFDYDMYKAWVSLFGVTVSGYRRGIKTYRAYERKSTNRWVEGFRGIVAYYVPDDLLNKEYAKITDMLLKFAEFTNVGGGRTAGFGMIKYVPREYYES